MLCQTCKKRDKCIKLCARAEEYVNRDHIKRREILECEIKPDIESIIKDFPTGAIELDRKSWVYLNRIIKLTELQRKYIYLYYWKRLSHSKISKKYKVSKQSVAAVIKRARNKTAISLIKRGLSFCISRGHN